MFKKHKITCFMTILLFVLFSGLLVACTDNENKAQLHSTQPIEIFSVEGPLDLVNPEGPVVGIILKNISSDNIVSLMLLSNWIEHSASISTSLPSIHCCRATLFMQSSILFTANSQVIPYIHYK